MNDRANRSICGARVRHSAKRTHLQLLRRPRHVARRRPGGGAPLAGLPSGSAGRRRRLAGRRDHEFDRRREAAAARGLPPESSAAHKCTMGLQRGGDFSLMRPSTSLHLINAAVNYREEIKRMTSPAYSFQTQMLSTKKNIDSLSCRASLSISLPCSSLRRELFYTWVCKRR